MDSMYFLWEERSHRDKKKGVEHPSFFSQTGKNIIHQCLVTWFSKSYSIYSFHKKRCRFVVGERYLSNTLQRYPNNAFPLCKILLFIWTILPNHMDKSHGQFYKKLNIKHLYIHHQEYNLSTTNKRKRFGTNLKMNEISL